MSITHILICKELVTPAVRGMNFPNHIIPDPNNCMPQQVRILFLFSPVLQNSIICTRNWYFAAGGHPAICYLTPHPSKICLQMPPPVFHLMPAKCLGYSPGYCHCSATRVGREEGGDCPAHWEDVKRSLGRTLNKLFASYEFFPNCVLQYYMRVRAWGRWDYSLEAMLRPSMGIKS